MQIGVIGLRHGRQHFSPPDENRPHLHRIRRQRQAARGAREGGRHGGSVTGRCGQGPQGKAARGMGDVAGRPNYRNDDRASRLLLEQDDIIIDGGNSFYKDDIRRAKEFAAKGIRYIDCGTSGGVWGIDRGYCMMIGGQSGGPPRSDLRNASAELGDIPPTPGRAKGDSRAERGYIHAGPAGAGHFVKMVHQRDRVRTDAGHAEGFDILRNKDSK